MPDNIASDIISNALLKLETTGQFLPTDSRYKEVIIKLINKTQLVSSLQRMQKFQDYIFLLHQTKKIDTLYKLEE